MNLDIIGDVHGYAQKLRELLSNLGYIESEKSYQHPDGNKVVFIGDYIDRGCEEEDVLTVVKQMVDSGNAYAIMGNHEYNAICYSTKIKDEYLRKHTKQNTKQHQSFLDEYPFGSKKHNDIIKWFKKLPLFLEIEGARFVHASWVNADIAHLKSILNVDNTIKEETYENLNNKLHQDYISIETTLKGVEREIPNNFVWTDKDGINRTQTRINWFHYRENPTYKNSALSIPEWVDLPDVPVLNYNGQYNDEIIVFFGHYWMSGTPERQTKYCACVDYSVAKGGELVAYRYSGEKEVDNSLFFY